MTEYIACRSCESPDCKGCNLKRLEMMLKNGKFDCLMNENRSINTSYDVETVRHGRWMKAKHKKDYWGFDSDGDFGCWSDYPVLCSSCKYDATENSTGETNYCPNCGAKMDAI